MHFMISATDLCHDVAYLHSMPCCFYLLFAVSATCIILVDETCWIQWGQFIFSNHSVQLNKEIQNTKDNNLWLYNNLLDMKLDGNWKKGYDSTDLTHVATGLY